MFKFKLESVLSLREKIEDSKKRELGQATMQKQRKEDEKNQLIIEKDTVITNIKHQNTDAVNIQDLKQFNRYLKYTDKQIEDRNEELIQLETEVEAKRQELLEAVKQRKIIDNLKTIEKDAFLEEEKREEQRILDDVVTYRYGIKGKGVEDE